MLHLKTSSSYVECCIFCILVNWNSLKCRSSFPACVQLGGSTASLRKSLEKLEVRKSLKLESNWSLNRDASFEGLAWDEGRPNLKAPPTSLWEELFMDLMVWCILHSLINPKIHCRWKGRFLFLVKNGGQIGETYKYIQIRWEKTKN